MSELQMPPGHLARLDAVSGRLAELTRRVDALITHVVSSLTSRVDGLEAIAKPTGLAVRIELQDLERRVDGLEAVVGEMRQRVDALERNISAHNAAQVRALDRELELTGRVDALERVPGSSRA